jgi:hypothetical protein
MHVVYVTGPRHEELLTKRLDRHVPDCVFVSAIHCTIAKYQSHNEVHPPMPIASSFPSCACADVTQTDRDAAFALLSPVCFYHHHRVLKEELHAEYKRQQAEIQDGEVIITLDYKQNIRLNVGPDEASRLFYHQAQRTVLGFLLQYRDPNTQMLSNHYVDFISSCLTHDATFALDCLHQVISRFLLPLGLHKLHVWSDCGRHFHCGECIAGVTCMLPSEFRHFGLSADISFFAEKHGKSLVDGHFSLLSRWLKQAAAQQHIVSNDDLLSALRAQADSHLQTLRSKSKPTHIVTFVLHTPPCLEHSSGEHDILVPSSSNNRAQPSAPALGGDALVLSGLEAVSQPSVSPDSDEPGPAIMLELDGDGDVCMSSSSQLQENPSSSLRPSPTASAAAAAACFNQRESLIDEASVDWDVCADQQEMMSVEGDVNDETQMVVETGQAHSGSAMTSAARHVQQQYSRVEGRVKCTRPPSVVPSLKIPQNSPISINTHYYWRAASLPVLPSPHPSTVSNTDSTSTPALPLPSVPSPPCPVTLVAAVVPHSSVWSEQSIRSEYSLEPSCKHDISFAPRLRAMPEVVVHKNCMSAMRKRLNAVQKVFPTINAKQALSIVQSIADSFTVHIQQLSQRRMQQHLRS